MPLTKLSLWTLTTLTLVAMVGCACCSSQREPTAEEMMVLEDWGNTLCPVMKVDDQVDVPAKRDKFTVYEGKRVFFCCYDCVVIFQKNPQKYSGVFMTPVK